MKVTIKYINQGVHKNDTVIFKKFKNRRRRQLPYTFNHPVRPCAILSRIVQNIERTIIGPCSLPITEDIFAQLKSGDRILLKPRTCPEYDNIPRADFINNLMGFEHKIMKIKMNNKYPLYIKEGKHIPFLKKEIARITFICKR